MKLYWGTVNQLPIDQQVLCPHFEDFITALGWSPQYSGYQWNDWIEVTEEVARRYEMLLSPHVITLLAIYTIQRLETLEESLR